MVQWLKNLFAVGAPHRTGAPRTRGRRVRGRYDAAATNAENRRHWANADGLSASAANSPEVRRTLRNRSRYEVANNSYAKGIVLTLANDCIGTGPRLQMLTDSDEGNRIVEAAFADWANATNLSEKLRTMRQAKAEDGEVFGILSPNPVLPVPVQLDLRPIEADQIATPYGQTSIPNDQHAVDGIVFDQFWNPIEYHVLKNHPGDAASISPLEFSRVPAERIVHYFRADRPGQYRGVPEILTALPLFAQLRRYTLAVIAAAEAAADVALVIYTDTPPSGEAESLEAMDVIELERRMATVMPGGWKLGQTKAEQPATTYAEFKREILNEIARCINCPYNVAAANSSGYNYASGRLDFQIHAKAIRIEQSHLELNVLDRLLAAWLDEAALVEGFLPQSMRKKNARFEHQWFWDGQEHVDPAKEANAQATRLQNNTTTLAEEYARRGRDWESELRQRAKEAALMRELGLTISETQPTAAPAQNNKEPATNED